jgi:hypothetical protein
VATPPLPRPCSELRITQYWPSSYPFEWGGRSCGGSSAGESCLITVGGPRLTSGDKRRGRRISSTPADGHQRCGMKEPTIPLP